MNWPFRCKRPKAGEAKKTEYVESPESKQRRELLCMGLKVAMLEMVVGQLTRTVELQGDLLDIYYMAITSTQGGDSDDEKI